MDDLIGATAAARMLGISRDTLIRRINAGDMPVAGKLEGPNGVFVFRRADVEALVLAASEAATAQPAVSA